MTVDLVSLAIIALVAAACPIVAKLIPNKLVPETVFLLIAGALLGAEHDGRHRAHRRGRAAVRPRPGVFVPASRLRDQSEEPHREPGQARLATWCVSIVLAFLFVHFASGLFSNELESVAIAIALTTTALGTLMPILKERGLMGTQVGESVLAYGTWGELGPVLAMALLLSTRAEWKTVLILLAFVALCVVAAVVPAKAKKAGHKLFNFLTENAEGTSQTMMRVTVLLLVGLVALSAAFDLDIVLGAFAAGFVLRYIIPEAITRWSISWTAWRTASSFPCSSSPRARRSTSWPCSNSLWCWSGSSCCSCSSAPCPYSSHSPPARTRAASPRTTA